MSGKPNTVHVIEICKAHVQRPKSIHSDSCLNLQLGGQSTRTNQREIVRIERNSSGFAAHIFGQLIFVSDLRNCHFFESNAEGKRDGSPSTMQLQEEFGVNQTENSIFV